ncbi:MAG TPA: hypothetical protein VN372_05285 [Methanospirillum sp.]|nr:hypothetical protein [Methanospirillum sp.]
MITPRYPAGDVRLIDTDLVIRIRSSTYLIPLDTVAWAWNYRSPPTAVIDHDGNIVGSFERADVESFSITINLHQFLVPSVDLMRVIQWSQHAAPLIDAEPGQMVLKVVSA